MHTLDLPLGNRTPDYEVVARALRDGRIVVTKDSDFVQTFLLTGQPALLFISTGNVSNVELERLLHRNMPAIERATNKGQFARVGLNVCYETEIPKCAATLAEQGAEIILCPSFTMSEYGFWCARHSAQARCIENQIYFVHCATGGKVPRGPLANGWTRRGKWGHP